MKQNLKPRTYKQLQRLWIPTGIRRGSVLFVERAGESRPAGEVKRVKARSRSESES